MMDALPSSIKLCAKVENNTCRGKDFFLGRAKIFPRHVGYVALCVGIERELSPQNGVVHIFLFLYIL